MALGLKRSKDMLRDVAKPAEIPGDIRRWAEKLLTGIGDEVGTERRGQWLLAYEGWSSECVAEVWDSKKSDGENHRMCEDYAKEQTDKVLQDWRGKYARTHVFVEGCYWLRGLYGVSWALFLRKGDEGKMSQIRRAQA